MARSRRFKSHPLRSVVGAASVDRWVQDPVGFGSEVGDGGAVVERGTPIHERRQSLVAEDVAAALLGHSEQVDRVGGAEVRDSIDATLPMTTAAASSCPSELNAAATSM